MSEILCILDGMTDEQFDLDAMSSLREARARGAYGLFDTTPQGMQPESLPCILALLGVPTDEIARAARGWVEALGAGIAFGPDDLLLRTTCVSVSKKSGKIGGVRKTPPIKEPGFTPIGPYQGLLVLPGRAAALGRLVTYAPYAHPRTYVEFLLPRGDDELLAFALRNQNDDYAVIPWGQAAPASLSTRREGWDMIAAATIVKGIARALGMRCVTPQGATGDVDTDLCAKRDAALAAAVAGRPVCLHINGADEAGHRAQAEQKREFLLRADREVIEPLVQSGARVLFCADHGTSPKNASHLGGPQPFVLANAGKTGDLGRMAAQRAPELLKG